MNNSLNIKFFEAILNQELDYATKLLKSGADINYQDEYGFTALYYFVIEENIPIVDMLISNGASIDICDILGRDLLYQAIRCYKHKMINHLLNLGVNVNCRDIYGDYTLHYLVDSAIIAEIIKQLMKFGLKLDVLDQGGKLAVHVASVYAQPEIIDWLMEDIEDIILN